MRLIRMQYYVTIAPGMDIALIASLCVMLDERDEEGKK
jgi:uncharacterized protein YxjI